MNPQRRVPPSLSPRSIKTRFAIRFLRSLRKISTKRCTRRSSTFQRVKTAAYASMAYVVGPRRAWSRAVLSRLRWRRRSSRSVRIRAPVIMAGGRRIMRKKKGLGERRKIMQNNCYCGGQEEQLRRLVPGGQVMDTYNLLNETAHYIKCLTAQVMVMRSIANYCST